ncbi:hypothetical protein ACFWWT_12000 [Streptomyces sp. NPDC058676]|uniref:hypothetical protein n=1 Tax=unclassified Streptomyces TaxID=2593676 RepID=UPI003649AD11
MKRVSRAVGLYLLATAAVIGYGWLLWKGPWVFDGSHLRKHDLQPADGVVITGFRTMAVAVGAGFLAGAGLLYTHRNHQLAQEQFRHTQEQFALAQQQFNLAQEQFKQSQQQFAHEQDKDRRAAKEARDARAAEQIKDHVATQAAQEARVAEQYVTAIRLLASDKTTERIGGIYSLQQIASASKSNRAAIREMLTTFLQHREEQIADLTSDAREFSKNRTIFGTDYEVARDALAHLGS